MSSLPTVAAPAQNGPPALGVKRAISLEPGAADEEEGGSISTKKSRMVYRLNHPEGAARVVAIATQMLGCRFKAQGGGTVNVFHHGYQKKAAEETMSLINEGKPLQADGTLLFPDDLSVDGITSVWTSTVSTAESYIAGMHKHHHSVNGASTAGYSAELLALFHEITSLKKAVATAKEEMARKAEQSKQSRERRLVLAVQSAREKEAHGQSSDLMNNDADASGSDTPVVHKHKAKSVCKLPRRNVGDVMSTIDSLLESVAKQEKEALSVTAPAAETKKESECDRVRRVLADLKVLLDDGVLTRSEYDDRRVAVVAGLS